MFLVGADLVAWFIVGHCHLHNFAFPWDSDELVDCPWCGDAFSRGHMLWEYTGLTSERVVTLQVGPRAGDLEWVARHRTSSLGRSLVLTLRRLFSGDGSSAV